MATPIFAHGQMRLYLLSMLAESPMHGYELMQAIEQRFDGAYVPSAGTIYPRLAKLADDGLITRETVGRKTIYAITDKGRAELAERREEADRLESDIDSSVRRLADRLRAGIRDSMWSLKTDLTYASSAASSTERPVSSSPSAQTYAANGDELNRSAGASAHRNVTDEPIIVATERRLDRFSHDLRDVLRAADADGTLTADLARDLGDDLDALVDRVRGMTARNTKDARGCA
ncbi:PadR family transcriptional regulator [Bifidobacterium jacchi]|uniref:PadR family transcriptional regulator n=1 Tax=Bifidobacterium jacchi TaxID=2490545 RepID=A0A5N5RFK8_9BIFI|nr:PadR family transcriptional regulator [Bifidobacterium jacchi]KAB5606029.1 PadR family transcriptional regulator [Bifidobacterium jacchi]